MEVGVVTIRILLLGILIPITCVDDMKYTLGRIAQQAAGTAEEEADES